MGKVIGILILLAALGLMGVFLWPILKPEAVQGEKPQSFSEERSQAIAANGKPAVDPKSLEATAHGDAPAAAGPLCDTLLDAGSARAIGLPPGQPVKRGPPSKAGSWTWISLWAAWCKPCKEEMPLLSDWAIRLRARGAGIKTMFLSVDDDERQLQKYMSTQGQGVQGDFLWVHDEAARARFYQQLGIKNPPVLPVQVILDPAGRLRCVRVGSISQKELDEATRTFGW